LHVNCHAEILLGMQHEPKASDLLQLANSHTN